MRARCIGSGTIIGDQAQVREGSRIGERAVVGRASCVDFNAVVGDRVSIQTGVYVTSWAVVEDDVFLGPGVLMTNDNTMGRHPKGEAAGCPDRQPRGAGRRRRRCSCQGSRSARRRSSVPARSSLATSAARAVVIGIPARAVRQVDELS